METSKDIYPKKNKQYDYVQTKLYSATISHDIKQTVSKGKPPMTGKAQEILNQAEATFRH